MPSNPYLQRRGNVLFFRIAVPIRLRSHLNCTELVRTLQTSDKNIAASRALRLAADAKDFFHKLDQMAKKKDDTLSVGVFFRLLGPNGLPTLEAECEPHEADATLKVLASSPWASAINTTSGDEGARLASVQKKTPTISEVVAHFLEKYSENKKSMLSKHKTVLGAFEEYLGSSRFVSEILQSEIDNFFDLLIRVPANWSHIAKKEKISLRKVSELHPGPGVAKKTFEDTYLASIRVFLKFSIITFRDQGFPSSLTTELIEYQGDRPEGEHKQRAFTDHELRQLFESPDMSIWANDPELAHQC